jgi:hypothetical protein
MIGFIYFLVLSSMLNSFVVFASNESCSDLLKRILVDLPKKENAQINIVLDDKFIIGPRGIYERTLIDGMRGKIDQLPRLSPEETMELNEQALLNLEKNFVLDTEKYPLLSGRDLKKLYQDIKNIPEVKESLCGAYHGSTPNTGFCFGRSFAAYLKALQVVTHPDYIKKIWVFGKFENTSFKTYHNATIIKTKKGWYVLDFNQDKEILVSDWVHMMSELYDPQKTMRVLITSSNRFGPSFYHGINMLNMAYEGYHGFFLDLLDRLYKEMYGEASPWEDLK